MSVPAGEPVAGSVYRCTAHGTLGTASGAPTFIAGIYWGSTLVVAVQSTATANAPALAASLSAAPVLLESQVEFITSTTCVGWIRMTWRNSNTPTTAPTAAFSSITSAVTVTTSSTEAFQLGWTWSATGTGTTITIASSSFERVA